LVFLIQALVIIALPVVALRLSRLKGLVPLVVAQIVIGIALGPSLFGWLAPKIFQIFFNKAALAPLSGIAAIAVLFFGFITGLHLDPDTFRGKTRSFAAVAAASIIVPTLLGCLAGWGIAARYPGELGGRISPVSLAAAVGISAGVTALPLLGAILYEMKLLDRQLGHLALGIAGFTDGALWILLGLLLMAVSGQRIGGPGPLICLTVLPVYLAVMVWAVRPLLARIIVPRISGGVIYEGALALVCAVAIASALITESIGLHYILGAFVTAS